MAHDFRDGEFMSASEKAVALRAWVRFLKSGLRFGDFTNHLYHHVIQRCSFIAHYDRAGFYSFHFESGDTIARFLSQFDARSSCESAEYGGRHWLSGDCEDIKRAMIAEAAAYIPGLLERAHSKQQEVDIAAASALLAKYGLSPGPQVTGPSSEVSPRCDLNPSTPIQRTLPIVEFIR